MALLTGRVFEIKLDWPSKTVCPLGSKLLPAPPCMYGTSDGQGYLKLSWIGQAKIFCPLGSKLLFALPCMYGTSDGQGYLKLGWIGQSKLSAYNA
jgi:hypothetical protein